MDKYLKVVLLFIIAVIACFELIPAVRDARLHVPDEIMLAENCDCDCISNYRPWYSTFNYWFWAWILMMPMMIMIIPKNIGGWLKFFHYLIIIAIGYLIYNFGLNLGWEKRNGVFSSESTSWQADNKIGELECVNVGDGASIVFALFFAWIPTSFYIGVIILIRWVVSRIWKLFR